MESVFARPSSPATTMPTIVWRIALNVGLTAGVLKNHFCQATRVNAYFMLPKRNSAIPKLGRFPQYFAATHIFPLT
jgi:hypothetical protein